MLLLIKPNSRYAVDYRQYPGALTVALPPGWDLQQYNRPQWEAAYPDGIPPQLWEFSPPIRGMEAAATIDGAKYQLYFIPQEGERHYRIAAHYPYFFSVSNTPETITLHIESNDFIAEIPPPKPSRWRRFKDLLRSTP
jgi:hypothetical protein